MFIGTGGTYAGDYGQHLSRSKFCLVPPGAWGGCVSYLMHRTWHLYMTCQLVNRLHQPLALVLLWCSIVHVPPLYFQVTVSPRAMWMPFCTAASRWWSWTT